MRRAARNLWRLLTIALCLRRHNALFPLELLPLPATVLRVARRLGRKDAPGRPGQRLTRALQELGPSFIKLGQSLATRPDLIGDAIARDLTELQDRLPPFPAGEARATIEAELGQKVEALFGRLEPEPVAAASIAQVHLAVTADGEEVAVKILRPGIEAAIERDLDLYRWVAELVERTQPWARRFRPVAIVETFTASTRREMDLRLEGAAASELRDNFAGDESFRVPAIDWRRTGRRVLTLERVGGIPVDERERLVAAGFDPDAILTAAAEVFFRQVFRDGFFHADMHPGNLFIDDSGALVAVDFGIMGRLDRDTRRYLAEMLIGFLSADYQRVADVHFEAGYVPAGQDKAAFMQACRAIGEPIRGLPLAEISVGRLLGQLLQVTETFQMETQPQLLLLQKTMVVAEGVGRALNPEINMWLLAQPLIEAWIRDNLGPRARARDVALDAVEALRRLPALLDHAERIARAVDAEGLRLHPTTVRRLVAAGRQRPGAAWTLALVALGVALGLLLAGL
jgi:ubiquinone biosynthesis protein